MITTILGRKGCGKTTYMRRLIRKRKKPSIIVDSLNQFPEYGQIYFSLDDLTNKKLTVDVPVRFCVDDDEFNRLCYAVSIIKNVSLYIDEIDMFCTATKLPLNFKKLIHYCRHYNVDIITTSRRPANIPRDLTSQTDDFILFKITEPRDIQYIERIIGKTTASDLIRLENFKFIQKTF